MLGKDIIKFYYGIEGGKVNNEDDLGGITGRGGITKTKLDEHKASWSEYSFDGDMDNIPYELYEYIMRTDFWDKMWGDELYDISPKLIDCMYGWAINSGTGRPVEILQKHLCVMNLKQTRYPDTTVDGFMGQHTYDTLVAYLDTCRKRRPIQKLLASLLAAQHTHYLDISYERREEANESFTDGWFVRVMDKDERLT